MFKRGEITIPLTIATIIGSVIVAYFTAQASTDEKVGLVNTKVEVVSAKVDTVNQTTNDRLNRLENKIDLLLQRNGVTNAQLQTINKQ
jgi:hypothetical protein